MLYKQICSSSKLEMFRRRVVLSLFCVTQFHECLRQFARDNGMRSGEAAIHSDILTVDVA